MTLSRGKRGLFIFWGGYTVDTVFFSISIEGPGRVDLGGWEAGSWELGHGRLGQARS